MTQEKEIQLQSLLTNAYKTHEKGLRAYSFFKTYNLETSRDLVQTTFMRTWAYLVRGGSVDMMKSFLYHVLNALIVDEYRKRRTTSLDLLLEKGFDRRTDEFERTFDISDGKKALALINALPEKYRAVMYMKYVRLLSVKEISILNGQTKNTVSVQVHRGLAKLKLLYPHA